MREAWGKWPDWVEPRGSTLNQKATIYDCGRRTRMLDLEVDGIKSPHHGSLMSAKNRNLSLQTHWNWTAEDWKQTNYQRRLEKVLEDWKKEHVMILQWAVKYWKIKSLRLYIPPFSRLMWTLTELHLYDVIYCTDWKVWGCLRDPNKLECIGCI